MPDDTVAGSAMPIVVTDVLLSRKDREIGVKHWAGFGTSGWLGLTFVAIAALGVAAVVSTTEQPGPAIAVASLITGLIGYRIVVAAARARAHRAFERSFLGSATIKFEFDRDGMTASGVAGSSTTPWKALAAVEEQPSAFVLAFTPYYNLVIPKRFFASDADADRFRVLLAETVSGPRKGAA